MRARGLSTIFSVLVVSAVVVSPPGSRADTLSVLNTNDSGPGSLRMRVTSNSSPGDTIVFGANVTNSIILTSGELAITANVNIVGPGGALLAISGNNSSRIFNIASDVTASISGLTIANGRNVTTDGGGAILNSGNLTVKQCHFTNNTDSYGGGAIFNDSALTVVGCAFSGNSCPSNPSGDIGGAIENTFIAIIQNSTFFNNTSPYGGAIGNDFNASLAVTNCTLAGNSATGEGGGIYDYGGFTTVRNTIIAANSAPLAPDCSGDFSSAGFNLIGDNSGCTGFGGSGSRDQVGAMAAPINPLLSPLQDNGGPTPTMLPLAGSPVIDKGNRSGLDTDQRGIARPYDYPAIPNPAGGDGSDIGAVELATFAKITSLQRIGADMRITFTTIPTNTYALQRRNDLSAAVWTNVATNVTGTGGPVIVTNFGAGSLPQGFYRVQSLP